MFLATAGKNRKKIKVIFIHCELKYTCLEKRCDSPFFSKLLGY